MKELNDFKFGLKFRGYRRYRIELGPISTGNYFFRIFRIILNWFVKGGEDDDIQRRVTIGGKMTIRRPPFKYAKQGFQIKPSSDWL